MVNLNEIWAKQEVTMFVSSNMCVISAGTGRVVANMHDNNYRTDIGKKSFSSVSETHLMSC